MKRTCIAAAFALVACNGGVSASSSGADADAASPSPAPTETGTTPPMPTETPTSMPMPTPTDAAPDGRKLSPTYVFKDVNHVLGTGQSLSVGSQGTPPLSTMQPYANLTFNTGILSGGTNLTSLIPLVEGSSASKVETLSSTFANLVTKMAREDLLVEEPEGKRSHDLLVSAHGVGGIAYVGLKKGTTPYANGMAQAKAGFDLAKAANKSYVVRAVTNVHGESDHRDGSQTYQADLEQWQADYDADVKALTGQTETVPMFVTQIASWTRYNTTTSRIPGDMLAAHVAKPGKIVLVGPKYHLPYVADGVHLTNEGYRHMGEDYAKAYRRVVLEGKAWEPVRPKTATRAGAVVTLVFHVPSPPLALDTTLVTNPGSYGFEYSDDGPANARPTIASVALAGPDSVKVTLSAAPTAANPRIRYAFTAPIGTKAGPTTGARGNLRDSDPTASRHGYPLYNWCIVFDQAVP